MNDFYNSLLNVFSRPDQSGARDFLQEWNVAVEDDDADGYADSVKIED